MEADVQARLRLVVQAVQAKKGYHLLALDVSGLTSVADAFLFCSVGSSRQAQAVADEVSRTLREAGARALSVEGYTTGGWILMGYGDFLLHIFQEERRAFFGLERLWGDAPEITAELREEPP